MNRLNLKLKIKRFILKRIRSMTFKSLIFFSASATAAIPPMAYSPLLAQSNRQLDLQQWARLDLLFQNESSFKMEDYAPHADLRSDMTGDEFVEVVLKNSLNRFIDNQPDNSAWRTLDKAAQGFSGNVKIGNAVGKSHSLKFKFNPVATQTKIQYSGLADTEVSYDINDRLLRVEIQNKIGATTIIAAHTDQDGQKSDTLNLRWNF